VQQGRLDALLAREGGQGADLLADAGAEARVEDAVRRSRDRGGGRLVRAEERTKNRNAGRHHRLLALERRRRPLEVEVLYDRRDVAGTDEEIRESASMLCGRTAAPPKDARSCSIHEIGLQRVRIEVPNEVLGGRAEVRERELVLGGSAGGPERGPPEYYRSHARRAQNEPPSIHAGTLPLC
jgi:hypothetical protein